jgi:hypothetical protein
MRGRAESAAQRTFMAAAIVLLGFRVLLFAYSEEDWRAYSRTKVELVDTFSLPFEAAGPFVLLGDKLVFLSKGRDSLISLDTVTRAVVGRAEIASAWNMDIGAITACDGKLYLLSRSTRTIYRYEPDGEGGGSKVLLDLGKVRFDGEPILTTFAYDGRSVYLYVGAGFSSSIVAVSPLTGSLCFVAYAGGRPSALHATAEHLFYLSHQNVPVSPSILTVYDVTKAGGHMGQPTLDVQLPILEACSVQGVGNRLWAVWAHGSRVGRVRLALP